RQRQDAHDRLSRRVRARPRPALRILPHERHWRGQSPMSIAAPPASRFETLIQADRPLGEARGGLTDNLRERYGGGLWLPPRDELATGTAQLRAARRRR